MAKGGDSKESFTLDALRERILSGQKPDEALSAWAQYGSMEAERARGKKLEDLYAKDKPAYEQAKQEGF